MSDLDNYWKRKVAGQGYSRRRVLGGAGVTAVGLGALGLVGCGDDDDDVRRNGHQCSSGHNSCRKPDCSADNGS